ncbi:ATP-binding protein [Paenibacillus elgii]|uniref:ATP-binding protein n=1 Tax=Paenibacillus elgii TaxID=189691 RepID=UPI002D7D35FC|nr:ATP-binding protein [Paenibacillus elgii]
MKKIQITTKGIKRSLKRFDYIQSIAEYVWNGFDAKATMVSVTLRRNAFGAIDEVIICDNGYGIKRAELESKFTPFFESEKLIDPLNRIRNIQSAVHGKNGIGRLTFHRFCSEAEWVTTYKEDSGNQCYSITIKSDSLDTYSMTEAVASEREQGTQVTFRVLSVEISLNDLRKFFSKEFGWFLELNREKGFQLIVDGESLQYQELIGACEDFSLVYKPTNIEFNIRFVRWDERINNEYSRYYFIDSSDKEVFKQATSLNNKGDAFYHSLYIKSKLFDSFDFLNVDANQATSFDYSTASEEFKYLMEKATKYLREKRRPFLKIYSDYLIKDFIQVDAFPKYSNNSWDLIRKQELEDLIRELYQVEPRVFAKLNVEQKKTFVRFLDLIMDSGEQDRLFDIISEIVRLEPDERQELADVLKSTKLSSIVKTIRLIQDRFRAISQLKQLVFDKSLKANEVNHIQQFVEKHYWIFGEQYHLVTAAEPKFEEALRRYVHLLKGEDIEGQIEHPDKNREMDIFMVRWDKQVDVIRNIVVELKHPNIKLGKKQLDQVQTYMDVIMKQEEFNASNMQWEFILVGNDFDSSSHISNFIANAAHHGEKTRGLVFNPGKYKIYVRKWSEIFTEFEVRHKFLEDKLKLERAKLDDQYNHADEIIDQLEKSSATMPGQHKVGTANVMNFV